MISHRNPKSRSQITACSTVTITVLNIHPSCHPLYHSISSTIKLPSHLPNLKDSFQRNNPVCYITFREHTFIPLISVHYVKQTSGQLKSTILADVPLASIANSHRPYPVLRNCMFVKHGRLRQFTFLPFLSFLLFPIPPLSLSHIPTREQTSSYQIYIYIHFRLLRFLNFPISRKTHIRQSHCVTI